MKPRVLLDCDGVLSAFVDGWLKLINAAWGTGYRVGDATDWDVLSALGIDPLDRPAAKKLIAVCPGFAAKLDVLPGAPAAVAQLREIAEVYIVTSPWNSNPTWTHDREMWLERHFGIPHARVIHTSAKHLIAGDVLVDDKTSTCEAWRTAWPNGVAVQWSTPHNARDLWDGPSTSDWAHLIEIVEIHVASSAR